MIGFLVDLLVEHVLAPQDDESLDDDRRAKLDPESQQLGTEGTELDVRSATTRPTGQAEIGGSIGLRHIVSVELQVQHGDTREATRIRDAIVTDLALRLVDVGREILVGHHDEATRQEVDALRWEVDYLIEQAVLTTNRGAVLTITADTTLSL